MNHLSGQTCFDVLRMDSFKVVLVNMKIRALYLLAAKKRRAEAEEPRILGAIIASTHNDG